MELCHNPQHYPRGICGQVNLGRRGFRGGRSEGSILAWRNVDVAWIQPLADGFGIRVHPRLLQRSAPPPAQGALESSPAIVGLQGDGKDFFSSR
jgi:hypothetical protein